MQAHRSFHVHFFHRVAWGSGALLAVLLASSSAFAYDRDGDGRDDHVGRLMLGLDFDYATAVSSDLIQQGGGGALHIGSEVDLLLVTLIPEVVLDWHNFGARTESNASVVSGKIGGRIRFLKIIEPGIFAHVGIANLSGDDRYDHLGAALDAGVSLDLTILPLIDIGIHASWNRVFGGYDSGLSYGITGLHAALVL
jgi:hypothetical protein